MSKKTVAICGTAGFGNSKKLTETLSEFTSVF